LGIDNKENKQEKDVDSILVNEIIMDREDNRYVFKAYFHTEKEAVKFYNHIMGNTVSEDEIQ
jgi:hypothetical protein